MKKNYQKPAMQVVALSQRCDILEGSVNTVAGNAGFKNSVSGGSGSARSRSFEDWDDED